MECNLWLCRLCRGNLVEIKLIRGGAVKIRIRPSLIVKLKVVTDLRFCLAGRLLGMQVNMLIFHWFPETLDKDIVPPRHPYIHADSDATILQVLGKYLVGKLASLIGIHDRVVTPGLSLQCFCVDWRFLRTSTIKRSGCPFEQIVFPLCDLVGVNIELFR